MGLATIDHIVTKSTPRFTKSPSLVLIRLVLTEIQPFKNEKNYKEMCGKADKSGQQSAFVRIRPSRYEIRQWYNKRLNWPATAPREEADNNNVTQ